VKVEKITDRVYFTVEFEDEQLLFSLSRDSACGDILMAKYEVEGVNTSVLQVWIAGRNFDDSPLGRLTRCGSASCPVKKLRVLVIMYFPEHRSSSDTHAAHPSRRSELQRHVMSTSKSTLSAERYILC
jgi:hypothetical protein